MRLLGCWTDGLFLIPPRIFRSFPPTRLRTVLVLVSWSARGSRYLPNGNATLDAYQPVIIILRALPVRGPCRPGFQLLLLLRPCSHPFGRRSLLEEC